MGYLVTVYDLLSHRMNYENLLAAPSISRIAFIFVTQVRNRKEKGYLNRCEMNECNKGNLKSGFSIPTPLPFNPFVQITV